MTFSLTLCSYCFVENKRHMYCYVHFFPQARHHSLTHSFLPMELWSGSESYSTRQYNDLQIEIYCYPLCLAIINNRTTLPNSLSGHQLWQKILPKSWGQRYGTRNSFLVLRKTVKAEKTAEWNSEGLSLKSQDSPIKQSIWILSLGSL